MKKRGWTSQRDDAVNKSFPTQQRQTRKLQHELSATRLGQPMSLSRAKPVFPRQCLAEGAELLKAFTGSIGMLSLVEELPKSSI
jgi:hypothetical protein